MQAYDGSDVGAYQKQQQQLLFTSIRTTNIFLLIGAAINVIWLPSLFWKTVFQTIVVIVVVAIGWFCSRLAHQGHVRQATRMYLASAIALTTLLTLNIGQHFLLMVVLPLMLFVLLSTFLESPNVGHLWGIISAVLFAMMLTIRTLGPFEELALSPNYLASIVCFSVLILITVAFIGRGAAVRLSDALAKSEHMRFELKEKNQSLKDFQTNLIATNEQLQSEITERKRTEEALKIRTQAIEGSINGINFTDLQGQLIYCNQSFLHMWGFNTQDDVIGRSIPELWADQKQFQQAFSAFQKDGFYIGELTGKKQNGTTFTVQISSSMVKNEKDEPIYLMASFVDITERKQIEEALRIHQLELKMQNEELHATQTLIEESQQKYIELYDFAPVGYCNFDMDGQILEINLSAAALLGVERALLFKTRFYHFVVEEDRDRFFLHLRTLFHSKTRQICQVRLLKKDDSLLYVRLESIVSQNSVDNLCRTAISDITEHKRTEEEIQWLTKFPGENPNPVLRVTQDGTIVYANNASTELLNFWGSQVNQQLPECWNRLAEGVFKAKMSKTSDAQCFDRTLSLTFAPLVGSEYINIYGLDITERQQMEEQIKVALREKEILLQEVHHRVKNNMQAISSLFRLHAEKITDEEHAEIFRDLQNKISSMALIHEMLYHTEDLGAIDMNEYIKELVYSLLRSYEKYGDKIMPRIDVEQVFLGLTTAIPCGLLINELVTNCVKYAFPENKTGELTISLHPTGKETFELMISDTGIGLPEDIEPGKTETLGLSLVMGWVNQLRGDISIDRTTGTRFQIRFQELQYK